MSFRKIIFWLHLIAGVIAGVVIAIMSFTGATLAFEKQLIAWAEKDSRLVVAETNSTALPLDELLRLSRESQPDRRPSGVTLVNDPAAAVKLSFGRTNSAYVNPYTGAVQPERGAQMRAFMQTMVEWHRFIGRHDQQRTAGKAITGACNAAFLVLAVTGLYLWWPRKLRAGAFRAASVLSLRLRGKARDWNWHNAVGFWTAPVLIVLTATALPISYRWAGDLIYRVTGTTPSPQGAGPGAPVTPTTEITPPFEGAKPLKLQELVTVAQKEVPDWKELSVRLGNSGGRRGTGERGTRNREAATAANPQSESVPTNGAPIEAEDRLQTPRDRGENRAAGRPAQPVSMTVKQQNAWPLFSSIQLTIDPFTGTVLKKETFGDFNLGRQVRSWTRFLHTGEALGIAGQLIAAVASLLSLLLVWTGFALTWRRFFGRKNTSSESQLTP